MSKRRKKKKYPATLKLLCTVTVLLLGAAGYTFGNDGITPISDTASQSAQGVYQDAQTDLSANAGDLTVHFVDIGQGDCMVLTQNDHAMIIDAGDNDKGTLVQSYLEYLGISELDYAILTHPDADHIGGADVVLYKFDCDRVLMPDHSSDTKTYDDVIRVIDDKQIRQGDYMGIGDKTILSVGADMEAVTKDMVAQMLDEESSIICIYYGAETDEEAANKLAEDIQEDNPDVEIEVHFGGQPIYYYVISVE